MTTIAVSIHDEHRRRLCVDVIDVLQAIAPLLPPLSWRVAGLDAVGEAVQQICDKSEEQPVWLTQGELMELAARLGQTMEGEFIGVRSEAHETIPRTASIGDFDANNDMRVAIVVVDGTSIDVYSKTRDVINAVSRTFVDVRPLPLD